MINREAKFQKRNHWFLVIYIIITSVALCYYFNTRQNYYLLQSLLGLAMLMVPTCLNRFLPWKLTSDMTFIYYLFTFASVVLGSALRGYALIPYWDKLLHFTSGLLITMVGLMLYHLLSGLRQKLTVSTYPLAMVFALCFNMAIAGLWEIYEYGLFIFFNIDAINMLTTGAHDTLQDMIVCFLASLVMAWRIYRVVYHNKNSFLYQTNQHFLQRNGYLNSPLDPVQSNWFED